MTAATSSSAGLDLSHKAKVYLGVCFLLSTCVTAGIGGVVNWHFSVKQADEATRKADVRKVEDQIADFDRLVRIYMMGLNKGEPSTSEREAVLANAQSQYDFLGTLTPLLSPEEGKVVEKYRARLVEISRNLRKSEGIGTTQPFAQSVAFSIDERLSADRVLRQATGLPTHGEG